MKINRILPDISMKKIWDEFTKVTNSINNLNTTLTNKITALEELVMSNATASEIFENAKNRIVNSALGKALGLTVDTSVLDAAIAVESVSDNGELNWNPDTATTLELSPGYYSGGILDSSAAYEAGIRSYSIHYKTFSGSGAKTVTMECDTDRIILATNNPKSYFTSLTLNGTSLDFSLDKIGGEGNTLGLYICEIRGTFKEGDTLIITHQQALSSSSIIY